MKNWKQIAIPPRMEHLERDPRGFPIPYIVYRDDKGKTYFQINDDLRVLICIINRVCAICGQPLEDDLWFAGGPLSAFHPNGAYIDTPTHHECGNYAMKVCPYLAAPSYNKRLDPDKINAEWGTILVVDPTMIADRPPFFAYVKAKDFILTSLNSYLVPDKPLLEIEYWFEGQLISQRIAQTLFDKHYAGTEHFGLKV